MWLVPKEPDITKSNRNARVSAKKMKLLMEKNVYVLPAITE